MIAAASAVPLKTAARSPPARVHNSRRDVRGPVVVARALQLGHAPLGKAASYSSISARRAIASAFHGARSGLEIEGEMRAP